MTDLIYDENGNFIWANPVERLEQLKLILEPRLKDFQRKQEIDMLRDKPIKINYIPHINNIVDAHLRKRPLIRYDYAIQIGREFLQEFADKFFDLLIFIRDYFPDYIANKQIFCAFCSISTSAFNALSNSTNGDIVSIIDNIIDSCIDTSMTGAMGGAVNSSATFSRMKAKDVGYDISIRNESENIPQTLILMDNDTIKRQLGNLFGGNLLENKKK